MRNIPDMVSYTSGKEMVKIKPYDLNNVLRNRSDCASTLTTIITTNSENAKLRKA